MRGFSDAEKQQLQAKIKNEQERQQQMAQEIILNNPEDSETTSTGTWFVPSNLWRYGFLGVIICLLAFNGLILLKWGNFNHVPYVNLVVALGLLFHHIAFYFTKTGWPSLVMKTIAGIWIVFGLAYAGWALHIQLA